MEGRDVGHELCNWSNLEQTGSVSSSSGTIVSSPYCASSVSRPSSISMEAAMHFDPVPREETRDNRIRILVREFFGAPSANRIIKGGGKGKTSVMERWLLELGVGWVLHLSADGGASSSSGRELEHAFDVRSWIQALPKIMEAIHVTSAEADKHAIKYRFQFARFIQQVILKMLAFVDIIVASNAEMATREVVVSNEVPLPYKKLRALLGVRDALSKALLQIRLPFHSPHSADVERTVGAIVSLLLAKEVKAGEAIWSTVAQHIRTRLLRLEDSPSTQTPRGSSSDIHKVTQSTISNIKFLLFNCSSMAAIVSEADSLGKYVPQIGDVRPLDSMIIEMVDCLEENLANKSESFQDQGLGFLFLLNNSYFIRQQHLLIDLDIFDVMGLTRKIEHYMESYLQVCWTPLLSSLFTPTPRCFGKSYTPLSKFEFKFHKTYTTQKQWKVPDPEVRRTVRKAIIEEIIPGYTKYIEDNSVASPKFTPHDLEEMLQELFEG